jgi:MoaA/NifB/PqqE/SkfB family radical SAM enzyme
VITLDSLTIDINGKCNLSCIFCYQNLDGSSLPKEDILDAADENPGAETICLGGGEPFLHKDILRIITGLRAMEREVHIATNATLCNELFLGLEDAVREGIRVQVNLPASNAELYHKMTGKDLFYQMAHNIGKLKGKYQTQLSAVICQDNFDDVPGIASLAKKLELPLRVALVMPIGKGSDIKRLEPPHLEQLRSYLIGQKLHSGAFIDSPILHANSCGALSAAYNLPKQASCPAEMGMKRYISPRGEILPCEFLAGNVKRQ